jgi:AcrR family transcriptional regulator
MAASKEGSAPESNGPRRAALLQERSRGTRRALVRAALQLWTERGFERGIEETTVDEIVQAAGVTKPTFYFHFAHKEDILLELGWAAALAMYQEAEAAVVKGQPVAEALDELMASLVKRIKRGERAAVARSVAEFYRRSYQRGAKRDPRQQPAFRDAFSVLIDYGKKRGEIPTGITTTELAGLFEAATMEALFQWSRGHFSLTALRRNVQLVLAGATAIASDRGKSGADQ